MRLTPTMILALTASGLFAAVSAASGQQSVEGFSIAPGVLVDSAGGVVYLMTPERQVQAIKIDGGEVAWTGSAAAKPVAIRGGKIIAQTEPAEGDAILTLVALDAGSGRTAAPAQKIDLGPGVVVSIDDGADHRFVVDVGEADARSKPLLWRFFQQELSGPEGAQPTKFERYGALEVDAAASISPLPAVGDELASGRPPYFQSRISRPVSEVPKPGAAVLDLETGSLYRPDGAAVASDGDGATRASAGTATAPTGGLLITEGVPGETSPPTRRIPGDQFSNSADDRHLAAGEFVGPIEAAEPYQWTVYQRGSFETAARFTARTSLAPFVLTGDRVLYLRQPYQRREGGKMQSHPLTLVARDAGSGRIVWTRPVRDTRYQGPIPSGPMESEGANP